MVRIVHVALKCFQTPGCPLKCGEPLTKTVEDHYLTCAIYGNSMAGSRESQLLSALSAVFLSTAKRGDNRIGPSIRLCVFLSVRALLLEPFDL